MNSQNQSSDQSLSQDSQKQKIRSEISTALDCLYAKIPAVKNCIKGCTDCCGPVPFSIVEASRAGPKEHEPSGCIDCPHSNNGGCDIYKNRPLMCRLFATTEDQGLTCPHGARAEVLLTTDQTREIMAEYFNIRDRELALLDSVEDELKSLRAHRRKS